MGYDFIFRISVDKYSDFTEYLPQARKLYQKLIERSWFPKFGEVFHSGSGGYGVGHDEYLIDHFMQFTKEFPTFTFNLYLSYWDFECLYVAVVKDKEVLHIYERSGTPIHIIPGAQVIIQYDPDDMLIDNEITSELTVIPKCATRKLSPEI